MCARHYCYLHTDCWPLHSSLVCSRCGHKVLRSVCGMNTSRVRRPRTQPPPPMTATRASSSPPCGLRFQAHPRPKPIHITCSAALTRPLPHGTCGLSATFMGLSIPGTYGLFPASFTANSLRTAFQIFVPLLYGLEFSTYTCKHKPQIRLLIP